MEPQPHTGRAVTPFLRQLTAVEREKAAAPQRYALRHLPRSFPGKQCTRGEVHNTICLAYKVLGCRASFEEWGKRSSPGRPDRWAEKFSGVRAQAGSGDPPCLPWAGQDGAGSFAPDRELPGRHRPCQALPRLPSTPGRTATSPAPAISSPCQHVRIPGARSPARTASRLASLFPLHVPRHPKSLRGPRWAPSSGQSARGALLGCTVLSPSSSLPRGRSHLPVFCRDRRPFCWEPLSWGPSGGLVASVPRAGSKVTNTKARVTNWPSRSAHMVLCVNLPPGDLDSLCSPPPPLPPPWPLPLLLPLFLPLDLCQINK